MLKNIYVEFKIYHMTTEQDLDRRKHLDATISSNLSEHPLYGMTPRYRMRTYLRQKLGFGLRDRSVRIIATWRNARKDRRTFECSARRDRISAHGEGQESRIAQRTLEEMMECSKEKWRLRQLPTLFVTLMQMVYKADINEWKHAEEKHFERGGTSSE